MTYKMNPPSASHARGVQERQIRTIRSVLSALLEKSASFLDGEPFHTLLSETKAIVNSCLLTVYNLSDPDSPSPLTPNHILTMKTKPVLPPHGVFQRSVLKETLEKSPAFIMQILDPLEEGVSQQPTREVQVDAVTCKLAT